MKRPHLDIVLQWLSEQERPVVLDIGAHIGKLTGFFLEANQESQVVAVEPDPESFDVLVSRFGHNTRVRLVRAAVAGACGETSLYRSSKKAPVGGSQSNSIFRSFLKDKKRSGKIKSYEKVDVPALTADALCSVYPEITLLKMNCEGAEDFIFNAPGVMARTKAIYMSQHNNPPVKPDGFECRGFTWKEDHSWEFWTR